MKKIVFETVGSELISFGDVDERKPIFAKRDGKLCGMVVNEKLFEGDKWILRLGGDSGSTGHHDTLERCLTESLIHGYKYFVEDER